MLDSAGISSLRLRRVGRCRDNGPRPMDNCRENSARGRPSVSSQEKISHSRLARPDSVIRDKNACRYWDGASSRC